MEVRVGKKLAMKEKMVKGQQRKGVPPECLTFVGILTA